MGVYVLMIVAHCFGYCSFVVSFENSNCESFSFVQAVGFWKWVKKPIDLPKSLEPLKGAQKSDLDSILKSVDLSLYKLSADLSWVGKVFRKFRRKKKKKKEKGNSEREIQYPIIYT